MGRDLRPRHDGFGWTEVLYEKAALKDTTVRFNGAALLASVIWFLIPHDWKQYDWAPGAVLAWASIINLILRSNARTAVYWPGMKRSPHEPS